KFDCGGYSFLKLGGSFAVGRQRFIGSERLENEFRKVTRLEFAAGEDENKVLCRPDINALTAPSDGFEHAGIVLAFDPPRVAVVIAVCRARNVSASGGVNPCLGQYLAPAPASALEKKLPQPGHVAGVHLQVAPTVSIPA